MEKYTTYIVDFVRKSNNKNMINPPPVRSIIVQVVAKDVSEAMRKAWDAVRVTPEDYEIERINKYLYGAN